MTILADLYDLCDECHVETLKDEIVDGRCLLCWEKVIDV